MKKEFVFYFFLYIFGCRSSTNEIRESVYNHDKKNSNRSIFYSDKISLEKYQFLGKYDLDDRKRLFILLSDKQSSAIGIRKGFISLPYGEKFSLTKKNPSQSINRDSLNRTGNQGSRDLIKDEIIKNLETETENSKIHHEKQVLSRVDGMFHVMRDTEVTKDFDSFASKYINVNNGDLNIKDSSISEGQRKLIQQAIEKSDIAISDLRFVILDIIKKNYNALNTDVKTFRDNIWNDMDDYSRSINSKILNLVNQLKSETSQTKKNDLFSEIASLSSVYSYLSKRIRESQNLASKNKDIVIKRDLNGRFITKAGSTEFTKIKRWAIDGILVGVTSVSIGALFLSLYGEEDQSSDNVPVEVGSYEGDIPKIVGYGLISKQSKIIPLN